MFIDTSGLMCLFDAGDYRHSSAVQYFDSTTARVTHNYVLAEFVALAIARRAPLPAALRFVEAVTSGSEVEMMWISRELHERAMKLLFERSDKAWSLCDAVSFVVMSDRRIMNSLTTDRHFDQAGFVRLLDK
ncbi:MAG TPA: PIN domain-containing protein [Pyrinomonadaceae bacterium]|nr:PIN domain-containing protein [Pyrinomonadaceae bacterium]